jgi:hypothetical protein
MAIGWFATASNQLVNRETLQDAVNNGVFALKAGQTIPSTEPTKAVTTAEAETWCQLTATDPGGLGRVPLKSWFAATTSYVIKMGQNANTSGSRPCSYTFPNTYYIDPATNIAYSDSGLTSKASNVFLDYSATDNQYPLVSNFGDGLFGFNMPLYPSNIFVPTTSYTWGFTNHALSVASTGVSGAQRYIKTVIGGQYRVTCTITSVSAAGMTFRATASASGGNPDDLSGLPYIAATVGAVSQGTLTASNCETYFMGAIPGAYAGTNYTGTFSFTVERLS